MESHRPSKRKRGTDPDEKSNGPVITHFKSSPHNSPVREPPPQPDSPTAPDLDQNGHDSPERTPSPRYDDPNEPLPGDLDEDVTAQTSTNAGGTGGMDWDEEIPVQPPLSNFFGSGNLPIPKVEPTETTDVGAPKPKVPRQAHYIHDEKEDAYAADIKHDPIINHEVSDEEEEGRAQHVPQRYYRKDHVFEKYDFNFRKFDDVNKLAVYEHRDKIMDAIKSNRVVVIEGFTGCGKTTQVPQFILDRSVEVKKTCNIVVTQPRRIAAISVGRRVCIERGWELGSVVGYQVGMEVKRSRTDTMITYMTTGVLLQKLIRTRSLKEWSHIIIDEVHERDLETDFLLLVIKKILLNDAKEGKEKHVKLILMSATLNAKKFSQYFSTQRSDGGELEEAPIVRIPHPAVHRYMVEEFFLDSLLTKDEEEVDEIYGNIAKEKAAILTEVYEIAVRTIISFDDGERQASVSKLDPRKKSMAIKDIKLESRGSVLVFLPGILEIKTLFKLLNEENRSHMERNGGDPDHYKWDIVPLHSSITSEEQTRVFEPCQKGRRKIILSTNIAESSITVPDIIYVIDFCLTKSLTVDSRTNFSSLRMVWASVSQCIQRKGRTGRVGDGKVYRLVPKKFFGELETHSVPEMLKSSLEQIVLRVKTLDMGCPKDVLSLAIDPPLLSGIERAIVNLKEVGALTLMTTKVGFQEPVYDICDGDLTFMGKVMSSLPISLQCSRLIMLGHVFGVMKQCIIIAAGLSVKSPFSTPFQRQLDSYLQKLEWSQKTSSDCFALLNVYNYWSVNFGNSGEGRRSFRDEKVWGRGAFVQVSVMREIRALVEELEDRVKNAGIIPVPLASPDSADEVVLTKEQSVMIKIAIAGAFYPNYFHRHRPDMKTYERERSREVNGHDLFCSVYLKGFPQGNNGKLYARHVRDRLAFGLDVPIVKFEGSKVIAVYDNKAEKIGPISKGVYRAVKMRQIRDKPIEFNVLWKEKEPEYLRQQELILRDRRFQKCPPQIELPGVGIRQIFVIVTYVDSPGQFWIVYAQHKRLLNNMNTVINENLCGRPLRRHDIIPGCFCLAPFKNANGTRTYYRGKIISVNELDEAKVVYVDYGNSEWVSVSGLQPFSRAHEDQEIHLNPCLAVECRLGHVKPAILYGSIWHEEAVKIFEHITQNADLETLRIDIYSVVKSVIIGDLVALKRSNEMNINEKLRRETYADYAPENYMSEMNHTARQRYDLMEGDNAQIRGHNKEQLAEVVDLDVFEPPSKAPTPTMLKGPWSPLELEFQSLCHSSNSKQVTIDGGSVNSVMLDHEPTAPTSRLLVSASIGIQDRSGRVVARDTTVMPAIPGMLALMAMIFTPKMELRVDTMQSKYTGCLCGLGPDPVHLDCSIYQDHDVEIIFDTEFKDADISGINFIRYYMNLILRQPGSTDLIPVHNQVIDRIVRLMQQKRSRMDEEIWPQESYAWNKVAPEFVIPPNVSAVPWESHDIFLPHPSVALHNQPTGANVQWNWGI